MDISTRKKYYLVLADIRGATRTAPGPLKKALSSIHDAVRQINRSHRKLVIVPFALNYGDEVAGLVQSAEPTYDIADSIREAAYPHIKVRFVINRGRIGVVSRDITQVGGPVFKEAQNLIVNLKREQRAFDWKVGTEFDNGLLNLLSALSSSMIDNLTPYRHSIWRLLRSGKSQKQMADELGKHPQSVSQAVKSGNIAAISRSEEVIRDILRIIDKSKTVYSRGINQK
jgi:DNA-binding CsgD family transcriptional regulator